MFEPLRMRLKQQELIGMPPEGGGGGDHLSVTVVMITTTPGVARAGGARGTHELPQCTRRHSSCIAAASHALYLPRAVLSLGL